MLRDAMKLLNRDRLPVVLFQYLHVDQGAYDLEVVLDTVMGLAHRPLEAEVEIFDFSGMPIALELRLPPIRNIPDDCRSARYPAARVFNRRYAQRDIQNRAVLSHSLCGVSADGLALCDALEDS